MSSFPKQPSEILDYDVDMTEWFKGHEGDEIASVTYEVESLTEDTPALEIGPAPHDDIFLIGTSPVRFKIWIGGGTNYTDYKITLRVLTQQHRRKEVELRIKVRDK